MRSLLTRPLLAIVCGAVLAIAAGGCSSTPSSSGLSLVDEQGNHPGNFLSTHPGFAVASVSQCMSCHGSDLSGGIANQSCFLSQCHHGTIPGWASPALHGASAKRAPGNSGFRSCQICHANDFSGGGSQVTCLTAACHLGAGNTPHPANWRSGDSFTHVATAEENAPVCALCHADGANSPIAPPSPPAPAGTAPGCFNSTLCHGTIPAPHPLGAAWFVAPPSPQPHGNDAKAAPGATTGFAYCRACHGTATGGFSGGIAAQTSCTNTACHGGTSPHAAAWLPGDTYLHTSVAQGNAPECGFCHFGESAGGNHPPTPPPPGSGCFNNTLCHGSVVPAGTHMTGWLDFDNTAAFHGSFTATVTCETSGCHPISGHPTCTDCHFDNQGSRASISLGFAHDNNVFNNHRSGALASAAGTVCENCHQTTRTFRSGPVSLGCLGTGAHPLNSGCHYNEALLDPVLTNPNF